MIDEDLLNILACPETKQPLALADEALVGRLNALVTSGSLVNRGGEKIKEAIQAGLVVKDSPKYFYPVFDGIPVLLTDESVDLDLLN